VRVFVLRRMTIDVGMKVPVGHAVVTMDVSVEVTASPLHQQPKAQSGDDNTYEDLRRLCEALGKIVVEEHDGQAEHEQRRRVPQTQEPVACSKPGDPVAART
jgi:hypothetical protein